MTMVILWGQKSVMVKFYINDCKSNACFGKENANDQFTNYQSQ
jgi:hypothetical protein